MKDKEQVMFEPLPSRLTSGTVISILTDIMQKYELTDMEKLAVERAISRLSISDPHCLI